MNRRLFPLAALALATALPVQAQDHGTHAHHAMPQTPQQDPTQSQESDTAKDAQPHAAHDHAQHQQDKNATGTRGRYSPPPLTDADRAAAFPDLSGHDMSGHMDDDPFVWKVMADRLEWQQGDVLAWEGSAYAGHDRGRLWLRSHGEREQGHDAHASVEVLWGRPVDAWWDLVAGVRQDIGEGPDRSWLALGVQGLAPYKFEISATAYLGDGGRSAASLEAEYEVLLTNKLILQPLVEATLYGRDDPALGIGSGLSEVEAGLRLRYEFRREFAPYIGYEWRRQFGRTADFARDAGETVQDHHWVAGVRFWF